MSRRRLAETSKLLRRLSDESGARLVPEGDGYVVSGAGGEGPRVDRGLVRALASDGLLAEGEAGCFAASSAAAAWLKRRQSPDHGFRSQHQELATERLGDGSTVLVNLEESPVGALARHRCRGGEPWLAAHAAAAAERLRRDFEVGQLQPRITANWSASVNEGRRSGTGGMADLTDMALAARLRFDRAMQAVGPELSGVLVDVCCFLKGLEVVERERQWPARSAKLVLRLALESLARHYGLAPSATGQSGRGLRHWGAEGYRPEIT
jgi:hypothetical protein